MVWDMFLREVTRQNKNGTRVSYLQLVHNEWDPTAQASRTKIVHSFGRTDQVDPAAIERLVGSLSRLLDPTGAGAHRPGPAGDAELTMRESRPVGGTHVLVGLWRRLGLDTLMARLLVGSRRDPRVERVLFALGRQPGPGRLLQARRGRVGGPRRAHRRAARGERRRLLPGDGLADRDGCSSPGVITRPAGCVR